MIAGFKVAQQQFVSLGIVILRFHPFPLVLGDIRRTHAKTVSLHAVIAVSVFSAGSFLLHSGEQTTALVTGNDIGINGLDELMKDGIAGLNPV